MYTQQLGKLDIKQLQSIGNKFLPTIIKNPNFDPETMPIQPYKQSFMDYIPSWLLPVGLVGAVGLIVFLKKRKKRR
jgi:hypothetical protein